MSHSITKTNGMALTNNSRSFTTIGNSTPTDSKTSGMSCDTVFGSTNTTWGAGSIWGNRDLTKGFDSRTTTRDTSTSSATSKPNTPNEQSGIGAAGLGPSSGSTNDWNYRAAWVSKRSLPSARSVSSAAYPETTSASQQRSVSNAGASQPLQSTSHVQSTLTSRQPPINLSSSAAAKATPSYASAAAGSLFNRTSEYPPNVYTKYNRPIDPNVIKPTDSATAGSWSATSPSESNYSQHDMRSFGRGSLPGSRNGSVPCSHHTAARPSFQQQNSSRAIQSPNHDTSRTTSLSSQSNSAYNSYLNPNIDAFGYRFSQLSINNNSNASNSCRMPAGLNSEFYPSYSAKSPYPTRGNMNQNVDTPHELDDMDTLDYLGVDPYLPPGQHREPSNYANATSDGKSWQPSAGQSIDFGKLAHNMNGMAWNAPTGSRSGVGWEPVGGNALSFTQSSPGAYNPNEGADPRLSQLLNLHLRQPYSSLYPPYLLANQLPPGAAPPFVPYLPVGMPGFEPTGNTPETSIGDGVCSSLLYEYKSNGKTKRYELKDIYDHIAEFSGDQLGSRFIQNQLETANSDEKERVFREIEPNTLPLMTDVFGNYVIQKFFEHGDQTHKKILANNMTDKVLDLSLQMYGCRVVQKAIEHVLVDQQARLVRELENNVLKCVKDQNGNHVIQKAIERCPPHSIGFIIDAFRGQVQHLSIHPYGCRVIQRCLERCEPHSKAMIMAELMSGIPGMISDQYGNYVVQHVVEHDESDARRHVLAIVRNGLESYSKHKFASNVVEKCLAKADDNWRRDVLYLLSNGDQRRCEGEGVLVGLIKDNFGNYVIQKLLETLCQEDYHHFMDVLQPAMTQAKRTGCGKQVLSIEKKMHKFPAFRSSLGSIGPFNNALYQLPPPSFNGHYSPAGTTPPPLTTDTSLQSSAIQSINGDAVEGAAFNTRKGSELSNDSHGHYMR